MILIYTAGRLRPGERRKQPRAPKEHLIAPSDSRTAARLPRGRES